ncbi:hypothetical protein FNF27_01391 [Cafeteria roenbergensis]|uniref:Protein-S-isoprenylcysteine O-methyltransferase n=1 Tax=Cafeteria roenbergensis TaxID=33653 RepID=A0A5A8EMR8_CAFRO|nr:hypothetical protein FNF29_05812 [Cafeteria roenbergensis]KAA0152272.1 hypothetical protein FNF31_06647 [Cafeteria roenbergensis]KAA0177061.1 hypothetical protein FNF27_01391 [Cafeteria roenbergensis]|eukprot:KAA0149600.1 hypothetical protein FNF29_05812 [Cafeteria roenbergensis]
MFDFRSPFMIGTGGLIVGCWVGVHAALLALTDGDAARWSLFGALLGVFHSLEFLATALLRPGEANFNSYCILHSVPYWAAMALAAGEYFLTRFLLPSGTSLGDALRSPVTLVVGAVLCAGGLGLRYWAMWAARENFNHLVQRDKPTGHRLVTGGPYSISRHPSYLGWMVWAVGSQVLLGNVLSVPLFFAASVLFFRHRVALEEAALLEWYRDAYVQYARRVPSLLPFVPGSEAVQRCIERSRASSD